MSDNRNAKLGKRLAFVVLGMVGLSFASVPLYAAFCKATGFGGTTQIAKKAPDHVSTRKITVRFNTDVAPGLSWQFKPAMPEMELSVGEVKNISYHVANDSTANEVGVAIYQVQPDRAGLYFNKMQCFCFNQAPLRSGQKAEYPVQFFIDPAIEKDPLMDDVKTITLSYTFFPAKSPRLALAQKAFAARENNLVDLAKKTDVK
jgi:cytochrome c oxidase assembly protein subunit 11